MIWSGFEIVSDCDFEIYLNAIWNGHGMLETQNGSLCVACGLVVVSDSSNGTQSVATLTC